MGKGFEGAGIEIVPVFRKGGVARRLNKFEQSGGEKSISTMMYILALSARVKGPIRIVEAGGTHGCWKHSSSTQGLRTLHAKLAEQRRMAMRIDSGSRRIVPFGDNLRDASLVTVVRSGPY